MSTFNHIAKSANGKPVCPDCGCEMSEEHYDRNYSTFSCFTPKCPLNGTTLGIEQWQSTDLNQYREANRNFVTYATQDHLRYAVLELERNGVVSKQVLEFAVVPEIAIEIKLLAKQGYTAREVGTYFSESAAQAAANL